MAKRVSLKGKGADIFFGDYAPPAPTPATEAPDAEPVAAAIVPATPSSDAPGLPDLPDDQLTPSTNQASKPARKQESVLASKNERKHARPEADQRGETKAPVPPEEGSRIQVEEDVWSQVDTPATVTNSFRYTDRELSVLADVLYEISKQHGAKLTKQDVARLGLNVVLDDYQRRGSASMLGQLAARRRRQHRRSGG